MDEDKLEETYKIAYPTEKEMPSSPCLRTGQNSRGIVGMCPGFRPDDLFV